MEFQILHTFAIHPQPAIDVRVFSIFLGRTGVAFLDFAQALLVDGCSQSPKWQGKNGALRFTPCPPVGARLREFPDLVCKLHFKNRLV
jgi:hypothetical protein